MPESPLPVWPGWHTMPEPPSIRWSERAREALEPASAMPPPPELLWRSGAPAETPLFVPAWARDEIPGIAEALEAGYELRRTAGLPDGKN